MIIEYLNESADILDNKVESGELTFEVALEAYGNIVNKALDEYADSLLESVENDIITADEALMLAEMAGIIEYEDTIVSEASFDTTGLSKGQIKQINDKLAAMSPKQRENAIKALQTKYPTAEKKAADEEKKEKRRKLLKAGAVAAGVAGAAALTAYGVNKHNTKKADEASINADNPRYAQHINAYKSRMKQIDADEQRDLSNPDLLKSEKDDIRNKYNKKRQEESNSLNANINNARDKAIQDAGGQRNYNKKVRQAYKEVKGLKKKSNVNASKIVATRDDDLRDLDSRRGTGFIGGIKNILNRKKDKALRDRANEVAKNKLIDNEKQTDKDVENAWKNV